LGFKKLDLDLYKINQSIHHSKNWLLNSGIQNNKKNNKFYGSVNAWYDSKRRSYSFVYSEINGYFLTMMVYLYKQNGNKLYLDRAVSAAKWLIKNAQHTNGGFKCLFMIDKKSPHQFKEDLIYSFDNGVILNGLCSLYKITKKYFLLNSANKCANWLVDCCLDKNFNIKPVYDFKENKFYESDKEWSTVSGSYHTKIALGLTNYYSIKKKRKIKKIIDGICQNAMKQQTFDGRFVSFPFKGGTNAHPHCYSAEGLWSVGIYFKNKNYLKSSFRATNWISLKSKKNGNIPRLFFDKNNLIYNERVDALAQVLRLSLLHTPFKKKKLSKKLINLLNLIISYQVRSKKNIRTHGSFRWGKKSNGELVNHSNAWVTFFALQALVLIKDKLKNKKSKFDFFDLV
jgi:rhamnogalacturonyl hydrolase YesR